MKEAAYEGETEVDEVVGKVINRRKYYNIDFEMGLLYHTKIVSRIRIQSV